MEEDTLTGITNAQERKKIQNRLAQRRRRLRLKNYQLGQDITATHATQTIHNNAPLRSIKDIDKNLFSDLELHSAFERNSLTDFSFKDPLDLTVFSPQCNENTINPILFRGGVLSEVEEVESPITYGSGDDNRSGPAARACSPALDKPPPRNISSGRTKPAASTRKPNFSQHTLRAPNGRFLQIFAAMREAGFNTFDEMATSYYTCSFPTSSAAYDMQRQSRIRHLRAFLSHLKTHAMGWSHKEQQGWAAEILVAAEELCAEEIQTILEDSGHEGVSILDDGEQDNTSQMALLQDQLPDLWSLLSHVVYTLGFEQPDSSRIVLSAMRVLLGRTACK